MDQAINLDDITIRPLTPDTWFLTSHVDYIIDVTRRRTGQPASTLPILQLDKPSDDVDDKTSSDNYDNNSDENDEYLSDFVNKPSSSRKHSRWSEEDDNLLRSWKAAGKPWPWIYDQFPNRSHGAVKVHWHMKLRGKAQQL